LQRKVKYFADNCALRHFASNKRTLWFSSFVGKTYVYPRGLNSLLLLRNPKVCCCVHRLSHRTEFLDDFSRPHHTGCFLRTIFSVYTVFYVSCANSSLGFFNSVCISDLCSLCFALLSQLSSCHAYAWQLQLKIRVYRKQLINLTPMLLMRNEINKILSSIAFY
jgi:hypothetical protein